MAWIVACFCGSTLKGNPPLICPNCHGVIDGGPGGMAMINSVRQSMEKTAEMQARPECGDEEVDIFLKTAYPSQQSQDN